MSQTGRISPRVQALFPEERVYSDHEVAAVLYDGQVRALRAQFDSSPIPLFYRGPGRRRLLTREHIEKTIRRLESCHKTTEQSPANLNLLSDQVRPIGGLLARSKGSGSEKALALLKRSGPKNKGSR